MVVRPAEEVRPEFPLLPSKLHTQLACALSLLAREKVEIRSPLSSSETRVILKVIEDLGFLVKKSSSSWTIYPPDRITLTKKSLSVGSSATALAMLSSALSLFRLSVVLTGDSSLRSRKMSSLLSAFRKMGLDVHSTKKDDTPPFIVFGGEAGGGRVSLTAGEVRHLPALAVAAPGTAEDTVLQFPAKDARLFVEPVLDVFGQARMRVESMPGILAFPKQTVSGFTYTVREELSSSAPFIILSLLRGREVRFRPGKISGRDQLFLSLLKKFGLGVSQTTRSIRLCAGRPRGASVDLSQAPELLPIFAVLSCFARGRTEIRGLEAARSSKSDRVHAVFTALRRLGADAVVYQDRMVIKGSTSLGGGEVSGAGDYAVTAALCIAGALAKGEVTVVNGAEALRQAYPSFISVLKQMGVETSYV